VPSGWPGRPGPPGTAPQVHPSAVLRHTRRVSLADHLALVVRHRVVAVLAALCVLVPVGVALVLLPATWRASTEVVVVVTPSRASVGQSTNALEHASDQLTTYARLARLAVVLDPVVRELDLPTDVAGLAERVTVRGDDTDGVLLDITVTDTDRDRALATADAVAASLTAAVDAVAPTARGGEVRSEVRQLAPATAPLGPSGPPTALAAGAAGVGAVLAAVVAALARAWVTGGLREPGRPAGPGAPGPSRPAVPTAAAGGPGVAPGAVPGGTRRPAAR